MKLKAPINRVIVTVDLESKNFHTFENGSKIRLERQYDNFNFRYVRPVNAIVVDGCGIPKGAEILIHHNATCDTYKINNFQPPTKEAPSDIKYFSVPIEECYLWRENGSSTWNTVDGFVTALRLFNPYLGSFHGIEPTLIKNKLYITSGELKGNVVATLRSSDYEIIFQNEKGVEERIIRLRYHNGQDTERNEVVAIDHSLTEQVRNGSVLVGLSTTNCKTLDKWNQ